MPVPPFYPPAYPGDEGPISVLLTGIPSEESFGALTSSEPVPLAGIPSQEALGDLTSMRYVYLTGLDASEPLTGILGVLSPIPEGIDYYRPLRPLTVSERFSTPIINQNGLATNSFDIGWIDSGYNFYQEFYLPEDYIRGPEDHSRIPPITGIQVLTNIAVGYGDTATLDWTIERYVFGEGWTEVGSGVATGSDLDGEKVWFTMYADEPIDINGGWITDKFRVGLRGRDSGAKFKEAIPYDNKFVRIDGVSYPAEIVEGTPLHFTSTGEQLSLFLDPLKETVYASNEFGVVSLWATAPNPYGNRYIYLRDDAESIVVDGDDNLALNFRILSGVAESGTDLLGNNYRSVVSVSDINNATASSQDSYWLSKPNPSKFGVESIYFDLTNLGRESVIDSILLDPITTGVHFNVYYSSEGEPATDDAAWERKLWTRLPQNFVTTQKTTHKLSRPITAKYVKVEFTNLQPRYYSPGDYQRPVIYKKHPKWVLDYFLLRLASENTSDDKFIGRNFKISYSAWDLAYNYYVDDTRSSADFPLEVEEGVANFFAQRTDSSDEVDVQTLNKIETNLRPYARSLSSMSGEISYLPSAYRSLAGQLVEDQNSYLPDLSNEVSTLDRDNLLYERGSSAMYFFITCRHKYRLAQATFDNDKGYFAGVNEIAFLRDRYGKTSDTNLYIESVGDNLNTRRNDFRNVDGVLIP